MIPLLVVLVFAAGAFETASVRQSQRIAGHDGTVLITPLRFSASNATLKRLIFEAFELPYSRIAGGPAWAESAEFDIEARAGAPSTKEQMHLMLRSLLEERFRLAIRTERKQGPAYFLVLGKDGAKLNRPAEAATWKFHGTLDEFADRLAVQLAIPILDDPTIPSHPAGPAIPVLNRTGLDGSYDLAVDFRPEPGADLFTLWQRVLQEQIGLRLESHTAAVEMLVIDHAEKPAVSGN